MSADRQGSAYVRPLKRLRGFGYYIARSSEAISSVAKLQNVSQTA
jgi:hypothetical protein